MQSTMPTSHRTLVLICALALGACTTPSVQDRAKSQQADVERRVRATQSSSLADQAGPRPKGSQAAADVQAREQRQMPVVRRASKPWLGGTLVPTTSEDALPSVFSEPFVLDFSDLGAGGGVSLQVAVARLSKVTGVPVRLSADVFSARNNPGSPAAPAAGVPVRITPGQPLQGGPLPPSPLGLPGASPVVPMARAAGASGVVAPPRAAATLADAPVSAAEPLTLSNVEMRWNGPLTGYLNMLTDSLGLAWEYRDNTVVIMRFVQELHEIVAFSGSTKYSMSSSGSGNAAGGGAGASNAAAASMEVSEAGDSDPMTSIEKTIREMLADAPGSSVTRTDGSGRLMVKAPREMQSRVRDYVRQENEAMRRQVVVQLDLYSITLDESDQRGVNWALILAKAGEAAVTTMSVPSTLTSAQVGQAAITVIPRIEGNKLSELLGNSSLLLQALHQQGYNAQHRPVSMMTMNRQWGRISRNSTEYYLAETTPGPASTTGVGAPGLKTDKVTTGDQYVAMPHVLADNTVLLKFGISLSDLVGLFDVSVGQGNLQQKVQAPKVSAINAQFPVAVRPGEIVAVTGLSRTVAVDDNQRLAEGAPLIAGGTRKTQFKREHFLVFVRPVLM